MVEQLQLDLILFSVVFWSIVCLMKWWLDLTFTFLTFTVNENAAISVTVTKRRIHQEIKFHAMSSASPRGWSRPWLPRRCPSWPQPGPPRSYLETVKPHHMTGNWVTEQRFWCIRNNRHSTTGVFWSTYRRNKSNTRDKKGSLLSPFYEGQHNFNN